MVQIHPNYKNYPQHKLKGNENDDGYKNLNAYQLTNSDIPTFHAYHDIPGTQTFVDFVANMTDGRPMICTEYMARTLDSKFQTHMPYFKERNIVSINWGFIWGKTDCVFPWGSPEGAAVPKVWFHDIYTPEGSAYDNEEIDAIRNCTMGHTNSFSALQ